ncbi:uncharacterized protein LOC114538489 [Dendronephthya gigantea]|uniref:uncharacterized protein LOC114538489 n=1 Tax=Dendronephthya gigantea TaxID=151771 RepID=UPI00106BF353|nr:uncharacterized protein LOC114538489 [Dendronephthya gigantea]
MFCSLSPPIHWVFFFLIAIMYDGYFPSVFPLFVLLFVNLSHVKGSQDKHPEIVFNVSWNGTDVISSGDVVEYSVCINHTQPSTSNASNVLLRWIFPNNLEFKALNQTLGLELNIDVFSSYVDAKVTNLLPEQRICYDLIFVFDPGMSVSPGRHFITTHSKLSWDDQPVFGTRYTTHWKTFSTIIQVPGCSNELGIKSGYIKDHQMSSSSYIPGYEPFKARLNNSVAWCSAVLNDTQFIQVDFLHEVKITKLIVLGMDKDVGSVEQFVLEYSLDDKTWRNYTEHDMTRVFHRTQNVDSSNAFWLMEPFKAYNVRLRAISWNTSICLKLELYGCEDLKTPESCILPLGMESGFIKDEALSTGYDQGNADASRLRKKVDGPGGWLASPYVPEDYLQIDLALLYSLTAIAVEGQWRESGLPSSFVREYTVMVSNDSLVWLNYSEKGNLKIFHGPVSPLAAMHPTLVKFRESVVTRYVRILPLDQPEFRVMRLEVYGCLKEPMPSHFVRDDFSRRSYLLNNITGVFYVCLYTDDSTASSCQSTKDGYSWTSLSQRIVKVLAVAFHDHVIYGLDRSSSYLRGKENNWTVIPIKEWARVKASSEVITAREVPENMLRKDQVNGEILESTNGYHWAVSHTGVHMKAPEASWSVVATWKCCHQ